MVTEASVHPLYSTEIFSGSHVDFSNPQPEQFDLESIAVGLSMECRYANQPKFFFCVAEHSYWVSRRLEELGYSVQFQLAGLHHDDAEAFTGDVTKPMKRWLAQHTDAFTKLEEQMMGAIMTALDLDEITPILSDPAIHEADQWALSGEALQLIRSGGRNWPSYGLYDAKPDLTSIGLSSERACGLWLDRHHDLIMKLP